MTKQHDAPEGGAVQVALRAITAYREARRDFGRTSEEASAAYARLLTVEEELRAAPTPPAPSGLVDGVRAYPDDGGLKPQVRPPETALSAFVVLRNATLSGQQGGAGPAGVETPTEASIRTTLEAHRANYDGWLADRARLAEQPASAEVEERL